jgi:hypothetical protein
MGGIVEMCVSRALGSSLQDIEPRIQTIDKATVVNLCLYIPTNRSIDEEGNASHSFPRRPRRLCRVKNGHLPNGHDEGSAASLPASGGGERGIDAAAGYLMDRGVDFGEAIEAAPKLVARGLDSAALIRDADPGALQQASSLSDAAVLAALSHRPAAEVQASLSAMRGGVPVRGQRRASYSIDDLEDDEPLARRQGPY